MYDSPLVCSILSYFCRAESITFRNELLAEDDKAFDKEISAAPLYCMPQQALNYSSIFGGDPYPLSPSLDYKRGSRVRILLEIGFRSIKRTFSQFDACIFLSIYDGKENLGYETQQMIHDYYHGHREIPSEQYLYTSVDLLKIYHHTGDRIGGPLEVRSKWSFNLIKPRVCYSLGWIRSRY
jgi:hypothetical protein